MSTCARNGCSQAVVKAGWCRRHYQHQRLLGNAGRVPAGPAAEHVRRLVAAGATVTGVARAAGLPMSTVSKTLNCPGKTMIMKTAERLLSVKPAVVTRLVPTLGVRRRYEAMLRVGHHSLDIAAAIGVGRGGFLRWMQQDAVPAALAAKVEVLYQDLAFRPGSSAATQSRAKMLGYQSAMAWDDIDDPNEKPWVEAEGASRRSEFDHVCVSEALAGRRVWKDLTRDERHHVVRRLAEQRFWSDMRIAAYLGTTDRTIIRIRQRVGIAAVPVSRQLDAA